MLKSFSRKRSTVRRAAASAALLLLLLIALLSASCTPSGAWDLLNRDVASLSWNRRIRISIDNSAQTESFTDFPVLVVLDPGRIQYDSLYADGRDLCFYDADARTLLDFQIESWNPGATSLIWVKIPHIPASSNTDCFWLYYSSRIAVGTQDPGGVWSNGYVAVWHLDESGGVIGDAVHDGTGRGNHGELGFNGQSAPSSAGGWIPGGSAGQQFGGPGDQRGFGCPGCPDLDDLGPLTYSWWMYESGYDNGDRLFSKGATRLWTPGAHGIRFEVEHSTTNLMKDVTMAFNSDTWQHFAMTWDGTGNHAGVQFYKNGAAKAATNQTQAAGTRQSDGGTVLVVGNADWPAADRSLNAILDEVRIANVVRSPQWIRAQHLSMTDGLLHYGPEEQL